MASIAQNPDEDPAETAATAEHSTTTVTPTKKRGKVRRERASTHEGFLSHGNFL